MRPNARFNWVLLSAVILLGAGCFLFPRVLGFVELAARELRYLWWLVLIALLGVWLAFYSGTKRD
jgi:hypothetical protein